MARPRLLLVPGVCELEWVIKPQLEEWAEVASYDAPGVGDEPGLESTGVEAVAERGLIEIERKRWDSCFIVADEFGVSGATLIAAKRPECVQGLALGHARLSNSTGGERPAMNGEVFAAMGQLIRTDFKSAVRQYVGLTGGERQTGGYGEALMRQYLERVPQEVEEDFHSAQAVEVGLDAIGERLGTVGTPLLLAAHRDCLLFTPEGFEDALAKFPDARTLEVSDKPSASPEFAEALRAFCEEIGA